MADRQKGGRWRRRALGTAAICLAVPLIGSAATETVRAQSDPGVPAAGIPDTGLPPISIDAPALVSERTERLQAGVEGLFPWQQDNVPWTDIEVAAFAEIGDRMYVGGKFLRVVEADG
ncbi:MAG: hypothetical protein AAGG08_10105, partial [Actinomycetota bacterium]